MAAWIQAVQKGASSDRSQGFARATEKAARACVAAGAKLFDVLSHSSDAEHRAIAANALGYARQSPCQLQALVDAAGDASSEVRNNAVRALGVLLESNPKLRAGVPVRIFTDMVQSGTWSDRNKGTYVLMELAASNDRALLTEIDTAASGALQRGEAISAAEKRFLTGATSVGE